MNRTTCLLLGGLIAIAVYIPVPVQAAQSEGAAIIEEVLVTARRRSESVVSSQS